MDHQHWRRRRCTLIKVVHLHTTQIMPLGSEGIKRLPGHFEIGEKRIKLRCPTGLPFAVMECPEIASIPRQHPHSQWHPEARSARDLSQRLLQWLSVSRKQQPAHSRAAAFASFRDPLGQV